MKHKVRDLLFGIGDAGGHARRVQACYAYYEHLSNVIGRDDYTDGMYFGVRETDYETAQANQIEYLLDEARIGPGSEVLDLGCGRGRLCSCSGC